MTSATHKSVLKLAKRVVAVLLATRQPSRRTVAAKLMVQAPWFHSQRDVAPCHSWLAKLQFSNARITLPHEKIPAIYFDVVVEVARESLIGKLEYVVTIATGVTE
ncbi:hypothetical protein [Bythopirellula goksoeyrii]|uniref:Uncharacterized protein n=1 Tax=Bythopirellula goksoeyrii TaxID=1400387 RepID=A0A5B9QAG6_9BACT|nr:hypothetical protein [Bythopirellula goksoeyrii]QEG34739.1 hypothetical protein Pr1d_20210 [Bythopirellula goksoeyrii]